MNVGFYYMANAGGRLAGTVLSGVLYQWRASRRACGRPSPSSLAAGAISLLLPTARAAVALPAAGGGALR